MMLEKKGAELQYASQSQYDWSKGATDSGVQKGSLSNHSDPTTHWAQLLESTICCWIKLTLCQPLYQCVCVCVSLSACLSACARLCLCAPVQKMVCMYCLPHQASLITKVKKISQTSTTPTHQIIQFCGMGCAEESIYWTVLSITKLWRSLFHLSLSENIPRGCLVRLR